MTAKTPEKIEIPDVLTHQTSKWQDYLWDARIKVEGASVVKESAAKIAGALAPAADQIGFEQADANPLAKRFGAEVFGRLYANDEGVEKIEDVSPVARWAGKAQEIIDQLPEWTALRESVAGDPDFAALATSTMLDAVAEKLPEILKVVEEEEQDDDEGGEQGPGGKRPGKGKSKVSGADKIRAGLRGAIQKAKEGVEQAREGLAGLAPGLENCPREADQPDTRRLTLAERLKKDQRLREVLRRAGRLHRLAEEKKKVRSQHSYEEVLGIETGGDVARLLSSELVKMADEDLEILVLRDIIERQALQYLLEGHETLGRGPIVGIFDFSGSMSGDPSMTASAVGIALLGIGAREKRMVTVAQFDTRILDVVRLERDGETRMLHRNDPSLLGHGSLKGIADAALRVAGWSTSGGTDFSQPLQYALACGVLEDRADLVFVTDGMASADEKTMEKLRDAKARGLRIFGMTVNGGCMSESVIDICTEVVDLDAARDKVGAAGRGLP
jgi:hypothetical protein